MITHSYHFYSLQVEDDKFNALVESHDLALMDYHGQTVLHITGTASLLSYLPINVKVSLL